MEPVVSRCGMRCDLCLAYTPNHPADIEQLQQLSNGWQKYFGFRIPAEDIHCDGCLAEAGELLDKDCPVRPCAMERGLESCAQCEAYVCGKLRRRLVDRETIEEKLGSAIPAEDYELAVRPFENRKRLEELRSEWEARSQVSGPSGRRPPT